MLNVNAGGSLSANSAANSASPGDYISVFGTGLFVEVTSDDPGPPPDGSPAPSDPPVRFNYTVGSVFDYGNPIIDLGDPASTPSQWVGLAPSLVGVDQINVQVPADVREGCAVPLEILAGVQNAISQPVSVSIHNGGGQCVDPPSAGYGQVTWEKTITATASGSSTETDAVMVSLQASPGRQAPPPPFYSATAIDYNQLTFFGPSCPIPGYRGLDAGAITASGPGFPPIDAAAIPMPLDELTPLIQGPGGIYLQQSQVSGLTIYEATLPTGSIQPGSFSVSAAGGSDVAAFQSSARIGSGIQVTTPLLGQDFPGDQPLTINWTGGDPNAWVTLRVVCHGGVDDAYVIQAHASDGTLTIPIFATSFVNGVGQYTLLIPSCSAPDEFILEVTPDPSQIPSFSASGLSLGGQSTWKYTYRFEGVAIQYQ